jgi:hypothetical protein
MDEMVANANISCSKGWTDDPLNTGNKVGFVKVSMLLFQSKLKGHIMMKRVVRNSGNIFVSKSFQTVQTGMLL